MTPPPVTANPTPAVDKAAAPVSVENGTGLAGRADDIAATLVSDGFTQSAGGVNVPYTTTTSLTYGPGERAQARAVAKEPGPARPRDAPLRHVGDIGDRRRLAERCHLPGKQSGRLTGHVAGPVSRRRRVLGRGLRHAAAWLDS